MMKFLKIKNNLWNYQKLNLIKIFQVKLKKIMIIKILEDIGLKYILKTINKIHSNFRNRKTHQI